MTSDDPVQSEPKAVEPSEVVVPDDDDAEVDVKEPSVVEALTDLFDVSLALTITLLRLPAIGIARLLSLLIRPFEFLLAVRHGFAEARLVQSPDRRLRDLILFLPAVAAMIATGAAVVAGAMNRANLSGEYRRLAAESETRGDSGAARVYAGRWHDLDGSPESLFRLAKAYEAHGDADEAETTMRRLAEESEYGPALSWEAERALDDPSTFRDLGRLDEAISLLKRAEKAGVPAGELAAPLAKSLLARGDVTAAVPYLERAAETDPSLRLGLAGAYARLGRTDDARQAATAAESELRRLVRDEPSNRQRRAQWVTCLLNLGQTDDAVAALRDAGVRALVEDAALGDLFVIACLAKERQAESAGASPPERLAWLRDASEVRPHSETLLLRLVALSRDRTTSLGAEADRLLKERLPGQVPPTVLVALGTQAWEADDRRRALSYLERAYAADPSNVVAANNVAWLLSRQGPGELDRALSIANELVAKYPDAVQFRDTRGQILAKMGRWDQALVDLERALGGMRDSVETRRSLAAAYRNAGQLRLADLQDREADRLEAAQPRRPPTRRDPVEAPKPSGLNGSR